MTIEFEIVDASDDDEEEDTDEDDDSEEETSGEFEEIEFTLTKDEIKNEWIEELVRLKDEKDSIVLPIDDELVLKINYDKEEE